MSHVCRIKTIVKDLKALKAIVKQLGLEWCEGQQTYRWYGHYMRDSPLPEGFTAEQLGKCEHAIKVPNNKAAYEVGVAKNPNGPGHVLLFDFWQGGYGLEDAIGKQGQKLVQGYSTQVAVTELRREGLSVRQHVTADGRIIVTGDELE